MVSVFVFLHRSDPNFDLIRLIRPSITKISGIYMETAIGDLPFYPDFLVSWYIICSPHVLFDSLLLESAIVGDSVLLSSLPFI
jgi:hypothetical protein